VGVILGVKYRLFVLLLQDIIKTINVVNSGLRAYFKRKQRNMKNIYR